MRTLTAGLDSMRRHPAALVPVVIEGTLFAILNGMGMMPGGGSGAAAGAAFPMDVFFDLKQSVAFAPGWMWFAVLMLVSILGRGAVIAATVWLSEDDRLPFRSYLIKGFRLVGTAVLVMAPSAALFFITVATRYAPFGYVAAAIGVLATVWLAGRMTSMFTDHPRSTPGLSSVLAYGYLVAGSSAVLAILNDRSRWVAAAFIVLMGPIHAVTILGWRQRALTPHGERRWFVLAATALLFGALFIDASLDRTLRSPEPAAEVSGRLFLLGGADSTSETGSLSGFDPTAVGIPVEQTSLLSYVGRGQPYDANDTRRSLRGIARLVSSQIAQSEPPPRRLVLGHSQASQILDLGALLDLATPEAAAVVSPPPAYGPPVAVPKAGDPAAGSVGGDLARAFSVLLDVSGLPAYDVDAGASPTNLDVFVPEEPRYPRLSVWAIADSVWLSGDWRHEGHANVVAFSDHVGALNDPATTGAVRRFFAGESVTDDDLSWRGFLATTLRYTFEPWRPR